MSELIDRFLEELNAESNQSPERLQILRTLVTRVIELAELDPDTSDLRIAATALSELLKSAELFAAWRERPKITVFGSARTPATSPLYEMARQLSDEMAARGWMTVSGAGPGIMAASSKGAGRESTLGINIELPFEHGANEFIDVEQMHVAMKYFFTRKVAMTRASRAFVAFPGGVGTMDELFEILTLVHTGKTDPAPVVLIDEPGGSYWKGWLRFMEESVIAHGYLDEVDTHLFSIHYSVADAIEEIEHFYSNFVAYAKTERGASLRLRRMPTSSQLVRLSEDFSMFSSSGGFRVGEDNRLLFDFDGRDYVSLRRLIDAINELAD
jgi:uncharacterized protein (TIGR00730 family)